MTIYDETLRRRAIQDFIKNNKRSMAKAELNQLIYEIEQRYPTVEQVGMVGYDLVRPHHKEVSSIAVENTNRKAMFDDAITINSKLNKLFQLLEDSYSGFYATSKRIERLLNQTEARLDNLLLLNGTADAFVSGIEETFDTQVAVNHSESSATVENGYVTLGRQGYTLIDLSNISLQASSTGNVKSLGVTASSPIEYLKNDDGSIWEYVVHTKSQQGRVSLILTINLFSPTYIGEIRLSGFPIAVNKKMTSTCFYSLDGSTYKAFEPVEQVVTGDVVYQLGMDSVQKLQILFSKEAADIVSADKSKYSYVFSFDSLKIYSDNFKTSKQSILICGPYNIINDIGNPVYFTKATFSACTNEPENTSVSFYLSKDGNIWSAVAHDNNSSNFVSFGDNTPSQSVSFINEALPSSAVLEQGNNLDDIDFQAEGILNTYINSDWVDLIPLNSILIKRNIVNGNSPSSLFQTSPGWYFDQNSQRYSCTIYVADPGGRYINLGNTSAYINETLVSGEVYLPQGYSFFSTADSNWVEVEFCTTIEQLEQADPLYPYNHKYIIEGYNYPNNFSGERIYNGIDEYFGILMIYRSPEEFTLIEKADPLYYKVFTIEESNSDWYIKVKVDKTNASWKEEQFGSTWLVQSDNSNQIYVKALLSTIDTTKSPRIDSFKVRVI